MSKELELIEQVGGQSIEKYELVERHQVGDTPFVIVKTDKGCFVGFGQYRLTDFVEYDQAEAYILTHDWAFLASFISVIAENIFKDLASRQA